MPAPKRHEAKEQLIALAFEGRWTHEEMAGRVGVSSRTVERWLAEDETKARIAAMRSDLADSLRGVAYADKASRILALSQMAESARREYEARPWLEERRPSGDGEIVNESFNRDAHAAFREALNDIAKELGERSSNVHVSATQQNFGITLVLERMRNDSSIADAAADFVGLIDAACEAGE